MCLHVYCVWFVVRKIFRILNSAQLLRDLSTRIPQPHAIQHRHATKLRALEQNHHHLSNRASSWPCPHADVVCFEHRLCTILSSQCSSWHSMHTHTLQVLVSVCCRGAPSLAACFWPYLNLCAHQSVPMSEWRRVLLDKFGGALIVWAVRLHNE